MHGTYTQFIPPRASSDAPLCFSHAAATFRGHDLLDYPLAQFCNAPYTSTTVWPRLGSFVVSV